MKKNNLHHIAIVTTHPIQYNAPIFAQLSQIKNIKLKVFYTWEQSKDGFIYDVDFKLFRKWDVPLLTNYDYEFIRNIAAKPGSNHFRGINNPELINKLNTYKPDSILIIGWKFKSHLAVLRYFKNKIPIIVRGDSTCLDDESLPFYMQILKYLVLHWVHKYIDHALFVGQCNKEYYKKYSLLKDDKLHYVPHVVDLKKFQDDNLLYEKESVEWKIKLGLKTTDIVFLFAGKFESKKNVALLIYAFLSLKEPTAKLILLGNGSLLTSYLDIIKDNPNIIIIGFQNQSRMPVVYRLCNVFVLPSKGPGETWGLSINEAMACSKPVIVSDKCGAAIDIVTENTGWIFSSEDVASLMYCLKQAIVNKDKLSIMGEEAKVKISENDVTTVANAIEKVCSKISKTPA